MVKVVISVALVCLAAGSWLYLDCLNKQEQKITEQMHDGVELARAEAKKRAETKATFEYQINANLVACQGAAEKAKTDYMALIQKTAPIKRGQAVVPQTIVDEVGVVLTTAKAECQQIYDTRLKSGQ